MLVVSKADCHSLRTLIASQALIVYIEGGLMFNLEKSLARRDTIQHIYSSLNHPRIIQSLKKCVK